MERQRQWHHGGVRDDGATMEVPHSQRNLVLRRHQFQQHQQSLDREMAEDIREGPDDSIRDGATASMSIPWYDPRAQAPIIRPPPPPPQRMDISMRSIGRWDEMGGDDFREESGPTGREDVSDDEGLRIHEDLKRFNDTDDEDMADEGEHRNKRRRVGEVLRSVPPQLQAAAQQVSMGFFNSVPSMGERDQNLMEYTLPLTLPCMFKGLAFTDFAQAWCYVIVIGHTIETMVSDFGPNTAKYRWKSWIFPLYHHLMDCFWLHTFISTMFLVPSLFGSKSYWMAVALVQTLPIYLSVSFKTHYLKNSHSLTNNKEGRERIELGLMDVFWLYAFATLFLLLGGEKEETWHYLLLGVILFNIAPLYLTWSYNIRFLAATEKGSTEKVGHQEASKTRRYTEKVAHQKGTNCKSTGGATNNVNEDDDATTNNVNGDDDAMKKKKDE